MSKKIIGIDINEVLRSRSLQFDRYFVEEFGEENIVNPDQPYKFDLRNDYIWEDGDETIEYLNEDLPDNISPLDYQIDEKTGKAPVDDFAFRKETVRVTAEEKFKRFLYQDYLLEIHGTAPPLYKDLAKDLEKFFVTYKDQFDIVIISKENWFTIPPTLFFLSKLMPRIKQFIFVDTDEEVWNKVDILITTDPELLASKPKGKSVVKLTRPYNGDSSAELEAFQVIEFADAERFNETTSKFKELIGYVEPTPVQLGGELSENTIITIEENKQ